MKSLAPIALLILLTAAAFFTDDPATALLVLGGTGFAAYYFRPDRPRPTPYGDKLIPRARFR